MVVTRTPMWLYADTWWRKRTRVAVMRVLSHLMMCNLYLSSCSCRWSRCGTIRVDVDGDPRARCGRGDSTRSPRGKESVADINNRLARRMERQGLEVEKLQYRVLVTCVASQQNARLDR